MLTCIVELDCPAAEFGIYINAATKLLDKDSSPNPVLPLQQQPNSLI